MREYLFFILACLFFFQVKAQYQTVPCATTDYISWLETQQPGITSDINEAFFNAKRNSLIKYKNKKDTIYTIQVVFHVLYNNSSQNIDDQYIESQLDVLNACFRRTNADTVNTRAVFLPVAADAGIEFKLAEEDPDGNPTTGIIRKQTALQTFGTIPINLAAVDQVKLSPYGSPAWDTEQYLNIWICDLSSNGFDALLGYAYPPTNADNWNTNSFTTQNKQGVVVHYKVVGENNPFSLSTAEKTTVHEVGHYLGLRHVWGDGSRNQGCNVDDFMEDTPNSRAASNGCNKSQNTCIDNPGDLPDMLENYMDYSDGNCQNMFTAQQVDQMRANLKLFRSGIASVRYPEPLPEPVVFAEYGLHPNPVIEDLAVHLTDVDENASYTLEIFNILGQKVRNVMLQAQSLQHVSNLSDLHGYYVCSLQKNQEVLMTQKVIFNP